MRRIGPGAVKVGMFIRRNNVWLKVTEVRSSGIACGPGFSMHFWTFRVVDRHGAERDEMLDRYGAMIWEPGDDRTDGYA